MSKALNHLDKIFILYSKDHYKRINDPLIDLAKIVDKACALPENYHKDYSIYILISETFSKVADDWMVRDFFKRLFCKFGTLEVIEANHKYAGELMLGQLSTLSVRDGERLIWDVGEADPELWPLRDS